MDNESNIKLFNTDQNAVVMPHISAEVDEGTASLMSDTLEGAILGDKVKTLIIPEDTEIAPYNYIFDFSDLQSINVIQKSSLKSLISRYGDVQLYIYNKTKGLTAFGMGDKYSLERLVPLLREYVFNNEIKVYKNFRVGERPEEVDHKDITKMRLNL